VIARAGTIVIYRMVPIIASVAVSVITAGGGADPPYIAPPLRITVVAPAAVERRFLDGMLSEAAAIWRAVGVILLWSTTPGQRPAIPALGITVFVHEGVTDSPDGIATLGWIAFAGPGIPQPTIHLSRGNALELMTRTGSVHDSPNAWREYVLARALGRALAHELGHYLLKSPLHEPHGLMRAARPSVDFFSPSRLGFEITADERARLAAGLPCAY
jgi:hypothetical protein